MEKDCNGWKNCATWLVKAYIDNERATYEYFCGVVEMYRGDENAAARVADAITEWLDDGAPDGFGMYDCLLNDAIGSVDVYAIAQALLDD